MVKDLALCWRSHFHRKEQELSSMDGDDTFFLFSKIDDNGPCA